MSETTKTNEEKGRPRYNMFQNIGWMFWRAVRTSRWLLPMAGGQVFCGVALAMLELFCAPAVLRQVEGGQLSGLLTVVLAFGGGLMAIGALQRYLDCNVLFDRVFVRIGIINDLTRKYCTTDYLHMEQPAFTAAADRAYNICGSNGGPAEGIWNTLVVLLTKLINFTVFLLLLVRLNAVLLAVTVTGALFSYLSRLAVQRWRNRQKAQEDRLVHQLFYFEERTKDARLAKDAHVFGLRAWLTELYDGAMRLLDGLHARLQARYLATDIFDEVLCLTRNGLAYYWLLRLVLAGELDAAGFLLLFGAVSGLGDWLLDLFFHLEDLSEKSRQLSQLREWLDTPEEYLTEGGAPIPRSADGQYTIQLQDVSFRYPGAEHDTIRHLDLTLATGESLAIVGLNGAGKTTLIKLLCGFLDPTEGAVLLNGQDIRTLNRRQYYELFGAVFQKVSVLPATVAENVSQQTAEKGAIDRHRVADCLRRAGLEKTVAALPDGMDTFLGRDVYLEAAQLSGGQEQRLMLARALYKDAPITVLDEPTAALDPLAESDLYQRFGQLTAGHSAVYISHRLASTRFCDRIILLEDGHIAECGTHEGLLAASGRYAQLFAVQSRYYKENPVTGGPDETAVQHTAPGRQKEDTTHA